MKDNARAIIRFYDTHISVLCPLGHVIDYNDLKNFGGSMFAVEINAHQNGESNRFDRRAAQCNGAGHEK